MSACRVNEGRERSGAHRSVAWKACQSRDIHIERLIDAGDLANHADAARRLGLTRARLSQVAALPRLPLDVQEGILLGTVRASERDLRSSRGG